MQPDRAPPFSKGRVAFQPDFFSQAPNNPASTLAFPRPYVRSIGAMRAFRFDLEAEEKRDGRGKPKGTTEGLASSAQKDCRISGNKKAER